MITWLVSAYDVYSRLGRVHKRQTTFTRLVQNREWRESSSDTRAVRVSLFPYPHHDDKFRNWCPLEKYSFTVYNMVSETTGEIQRKRIFKQF